MSKYALWETIQKDVIEAITKYPAINDKAQNEILETLAEHLAPKKKPMKPPKEIDGVVHYYCRYHDTYEPVNNMVMSNNKSKGYCKAAISKWNKANMQIKRWGQVITKLLANGEMEKATKISIDSENLKKLFNKPEYYNLEEDWKEFNKIKDKKEEQEHEEAS